jgi:hypothetical protein
MIRAFTAALCFFISIHSFSQIENISLRKHIVSVEAGYLGAWVNYERHLGGLFTVKSHLGVEGGWGSNFIDYVLLTPSIKFEPRYYYNFNRRVRLEKKTSYNAANYFALSTRYVPSLFTISNVSGLKAEKQLAVISKFGIKRTVGKRMNFEFAFGPGIFFYQTSTEGGADIDLRFGYNLK